MVKYAHERGVSVEGELGVLAGVEDDVFSEKSSYTNPLQSLDFFKKTGVDALAISYGTMHGPNKGKNAVIRKEIAIAIKEIMRHEGVDGFLVSHGSSTVPHIPRGSKPNVCIYIYLVDSALCDLYQLIYIYSVGIGNVATKLVYLLNYVLRDS